MFNYVVVAQPLGWSRVVVCAYSKEWAQATNKGESHASHARMLDYVVVVQSLGWSRGVACAYSKERAQATNKGDDHAVMRTMGNDSAKIEVFVDGSVKYTYATPDGVVVASSWVDIPEEDEAPVQGNPRNRGRRGIPCVCGMEILQGWLAPVLILSTL